MKKLFSRKEIKTLCGLFENEITDPLAIKIEQLRHHTWQFSEYLSKFQNIAHPFIKNLKENNKRKRLEEILINMNSITLRIQKDLKDIKKLVENGHTLSKRNTKDTNSNLNDLLNTYESIILRFQKFEKDFNIDLVSKLETQIQTFTNSMTDLDQIVALYNEIAEFKLIQPFESSQIAKTIYDFGFQIISEKDFSSLMLWR